jgi:hypothetical protein
VKLTERVYQTEAPRVDSDNGILFGVKLLGESSRNKRRYARKGMKEAAPKYEGKKSYVDHPDRTNLSEDRKFADWAGVFKNSRYVEGQGIFADLHLRKEGSHFRGILEAAQKFPTAVGFSHVAEGESRMEDDEEIVESIKEVFSIDLVTDPATTAGFFESVEHNELREAAETLPEDNAIRKLVIEMIDGGYANPAPGAEKDQPVDAVSQITAILRDAIAALADSLKAVAKANKPAPAPPPAAGPPEDDPEAEEAEDEEMSPEDKEKIAAFENLSRENAELKAAKLLHESGRQATPARMKALANCADEAEQKELLESWPKIEANGRPTRSPGLVEAEQDFPKGDTAKFAAMLR